MIKTIYNLRRREPCLIEKIYPSHSLIYATIEFQIPFEMSNTRDIMAHYIL